MDAEGPVRLRRPWSRSLHQNLSIKQRHPSPLPGAQAATQDRVAICCGWSVPHPHHDRLEKELSMLWEPGCLHTSPFCPISLQQLSSLCLQPLHPPLGHPQQHYGFCQRCMTLLQQRGQFEKPLGGWVLWGHAPSSGVKLVFRSVHIKYKLKKADQKES